MATEHRAQPRCATPVRRNGAGGGSGPVPATSVWMRRLFGLAARLPRTERDRLRVRPRPTLRRCTALPLRAARPPLDTDPEPCGPTTPPLRLTDPRTRKILRHSPTYYWHLGRARYWINNQNFPPELAKPATTTFLQTWHGTPLKRMQHDVENMQGRDAEYQERAARLTSYWDVLLSGSPYATACFRSAFRFTGSDPGGGLSPQRRVLLAGRRRACPPHPTAARAGRRPTYRRPLRAHLPRRQPPGRQLAARSAAGHPAAGGRARR